MKPTKSVEFCAIHEAGHAVVAHVLGATITSLTLTRCTFEPKNDLTHGLALCGGPAATFLTFGNIDGSRGDLLQAEPLLFGQELSVEQGVKAAMTLLGKNWSDLKYLAYRLENNPHGFPLETLHNGEWVKHG